MAHRLAKAHVTKSGHAKVERKYGWAPYVDRGGLVREFHLKHVPLGGTKKKGKRHGKQTPAQRRASLRNLQKARAAKRRKGRRR